MGGEMRETPTYEDGVSPSGQGVFPAPSPTPQGAAPEASGAKLESCWEKPLSERVLYTLPAPPPPQKKKICNDKRQVLAREIYVQMTWHGRELIGIADALNTPRYRPFIENDNELVNLYMGRVGEIAKDLRALLRRWKKMSKNVRKCEEG